MIDGSETITLKGEREEFQRRIRIARERAGLPDSAALAELEAGGECSIRQLQRLADAYQVDYWWLIGDSVEEQPDVRWCTPKQGE